MRVEEEIAGMPSYADECPTCRLSSDVDCVHVYVHPIRLPGTGFHISQPPPPAIQHWWHGAMWNP